MRRIRPTALLSLFAATALASQASALQDWTHWRGPNFDGSAEAEGLPTAFDKDKQVRWKSALPGPGASTPIVVGDSVFLTSVDPEAGSLLAIALDAKTGAEKWVDIAGSGYQPGGKGSAIGLHNRSNYASPSAVSDGTHVVFFFGNGDLVAYELDGDRVWDRNLQEDFGDFAFQWTFSASPTIWDGRLFLPILQRDQPANGLGKQGAESFLLALDAKSGETLYRHVRPSDAQMESLESYATPIPSTGTDGRKELLIVGGDVITGHDPATGEELWRWGTWNEGHREQWWRLVPSPVVGDGVVLACGPKGAPVCAVPLGKSGTLPQDGTRWMSSGRRDPVTTDVPTPLFYDGAFFVLSDLRNALTRVNAETGEHDWSIELPREHRWRASPTGADGKLWIMDHGGNVHVIEAETGEGIHSVRMGDEDEAYARASIVVADGDVFVRTNTMVYRLSAQAE